MQSVRKVAVPILIVGLIGILAVRIISGRSQPNALGVTDGRLAACPNSPNCVSTQSAGQYPQAEPIPYDGNRDAARARLLAIVEEMPRSEVITVNDTYIHAEFRSRVFGFVDDVEFYLDDDVIHYRAAARTGYDDLKVNPTRMTQIRDAFLQ